MNQPVLIERLPFCFRMSHNTAGISQVPCRLVQMPVPASARVPGCARRYWQTAYPIQTSGSLKMAKLRIALRLVSRHFNGRSGAVEPSRSLSPRITGARISSESHELGAITGQHFDQVPSKRQ